MSPAFVQPVPPSSYIPGDAEGNAPLRRLTLPFSSACWYSCFGGCPQVFASLSGLHGHFEDCVHAKSALRTILGRETLAITAAPSAATSDTDNPLFFCLFCSIGDAMSVGTVIATAANLPNCEFIRPIYGYYI